MGGFSPSTVPPTRRSLLIVLILLIIAAVLLFLAAVGVIVAPRVHLGWLGLFFFVLSVIAPKL